MFVGDRGENWNTSAGNEPEYMNLKAARRVRMHQLEQLDSKLEHSRGRSFQF